MALPVTFGSLPGGPGVQQPLSLLDQNFSAVGVLTTIPCAAAGQNAIILTPQANTPTITSYASFQPRVAWVQAQTTTATATINFGGLGARNVYKGNGAVATGSGDIVAGNLYEANYNPALNAGAGGWVLINPPVPTAATAFAWAAYKNLVVSNVGASTPNTQVVITADSVVVSDGVSNYFGALTVNVTIASGTAGANGLDTGSVAASTWYGLYVIYNPTTQTVAGLMSASFTSPTLPPGYTMYARLGAIITDSSANFMRVSQKGRSARYVVTASTNTAAFPIIVASGNHANVAYSVSGFVPSTASHIAVAMTAEMTGQSPYIAVSPNANFGLPSSTPIPPMGFVVSVAGGTVAVSQTALILLETTNIYVNISANGGSVPNYSVSAYGWEDNL